VRGAGGRAFIDPVVVDAAFLLADEGLVVGGGLGGALVRAGLEHGEHSVARVFEGRSRIGRFPGAVPRTLIMDQPSAEAKSTQSGTCGSSGSGGGGFRSSGGGGGGGGSSNEPGVRLRRFR
jgi:hypothetical protein